MATPARASGNGGNVAGRRKSILDLAPLELDCMNALWPLGEATVREVQDALVEVRPRAYTTIMTILDRLAHKGVVTRRKIGRAYLYRANLTPDGARESAVERLVAGFFGGSRAQLIEHLRGGGSDITVDRASAKTQSAAAGASAAAPMAANDSATTDAADEAALDDTLL